MRAFNNHFLAIGRLFNREPKTKGKPILIIPYLTAIRDARQAEIVAAQCRECSRQLCSHLYVWRRSFPQKATLKFWNVEDCCFSGMDLDSFIGYLSERYRFYTEDSREWLLDRAIAALIWDTCTSQDTPLKEASWLLKEL
jgi:hypothetical protein